MRDSDDSASDAGRSLLDDGLEGLSGLAGENDPTETSGEPPAMFVSRVRRRRWARRARVVAPVVVVAAGVLGMWFARDNGDSRRARPSDGTEIARASGPRGIGAGREASEYAPVVVSYATLSSMNRTRSAESLWLGPSSGGGASEVLTPADARDESRWVQ